jgi:hypothetical protein
MYFSLIAVLLITLTCICFNDRTFVHLLKIFIGQPALTLESILQQTDDDADEHAPALATVTVEDILSASVFLHILNLTVRTRCRKNLAKNESLVHTLPQKIHVTGDSFVVLTFI